VLGRHNIHTPPFACVQEVMPFEITFTFIYAHVSTAANHKQEDVRRKLVREQILPLPQHFMANIQYADSRLVPQQHLLIPIQYLHLTIAIYELGLL